MLAALVRAHDGSVADAPDEREAHVRNGGGAVQTALLLHLYDDVLDGLLLVLGEIQLLENQGVALGQLAGGKAHGDARGLSVVLDQVHEAVQAAVHRAVALLRVAEVLAAGPLLILRDVDGVVDQLADALVFRRGDGDDRDAQPGFQLVDADGAAVLADLVHHVEREHHGHIQLHELHGQVEVALDVGRIHDVDDALGLVAQQELAGDQLLARVRGHGVDARQVGDQRVRVAPDDAVLAVDGHAGEVAHMLAGAGELVEERGLAAVLVAGEREGEHRAGGKRMLIRLDVVLAALAQTGVRGAAARPRGRA